MNGWFGFTGYLIVMMTVWRVAFTKIVDRGIERERDLAAMMSGLVAMFWPLTVTVAPILWFVMRPTPGDRRRDREHQLREREREVEKLERKYGL